MSSVAAKEQGIASGANNALREVGGALGIAVMGSIFAAQGGYESAQTFVDGLRPAVAVGAAVVALGGVAALVIPARRRTGDGGGGPSAAPAKEQDPASEPALAAPAPMTPH
jgi:hypothetical protein